MKFSTWIALFSQTGSEIAALSQALNRSPDFIISNANTDNVDPRVDINFRVDKDDNVWTSAGKGIKCFNPQGEVIGQLLLPDLVANLTFGGENNNILYVTCSSNLYSMELNQQGK